jgi:ABC-2 type transport system permease protein
MPNWLKVAAHLNPLTYEVDAMRALMVRGGSSVFGLGLDFTVLLAAALAIAAVGPTLRFANWQYPHSGCYQT